ncbi:TetR/AcrR family transcriptional regulator [Streptomyces sp. NPDC057702]|uniref:TetR/AcrR family transcriptional regulator n=1 Tax=unclassified Streptomyces TaxID=2593676 RepID=UPI0036AE1318
MPTGVALHDARERLFEAAERILLRAGPSALTSRAVTEEAGCAKGVLHRHFADFDAFLAELVRERVRRLDDQAAALRRAVGRAGLVDNLTDALGELFDAVAVAVVGLVTSRDEVRARLRTTTPHGIPVLTEATAVIATYLTAERERGRLADDADVEALAPMLVGTGHLLFADRTATPPERDTVRRAVASALAGTARERAT